MDERTNQQFSWNRYRRFSVTVTKSATQDVELNGKKPAPKKKIPAAKWHHKSTQAAFWRQMKVAITVVIGCAIPAFSLTLSHIAGTLAHHSEFLWLACAAGFCGVAVLAVSLAHLRHALQELTNCEPWQAIALAVTIDAGLCVAELVQVFAHSVGLHMWTYGLIVAVAVLSAVLNSYAFLNPPEKG